MRVKQPKWTKNRRVWVALGLVLVALSALWSFALSSAWTQRVRPGWSWHSNFIGISTGPDAKTGKFPERDSTGNYERVIRPIAGKVGSPAITLQDSYIIRDAVTDRITYQYVFEAPTDPQTGVNLDSQSKGDHFLFPRNVEKKTYSLRYSYLKGLPVAFQREESIEGLNTYLFAYKGRGEYTESYLGSADYPGVAVKPGQEIKCRDDQFVFKVWVEPTTGELIKVDENCYSGDYVYDMASGNAVEPVLRWGGVTQGDDVLKRVDLVQRERMQYLAASIYLPLLLLVGGLASAGKGLFHTMHKGAG